MTRQRLRQVVLVVMAADFPLMYLSVSSPGGSAATVAALVVMAIAATVAAIVY